MRFFKNNNNSNNTKNNNNSISSNNDNIRDSKHFSCGVSVLALEKDKQNHFSLETVFKANSLAKMIETFILKKLINIK